MRNDPAIWNLLHDGLIVGVEGTVPGDVVVTVAIDYLRAMLPEPGNRLILELRGCCLLESDGADLVDAEILSARIRGDVVELALNSPAHQYVGVHLQYVDVVVWLENGRATSLTELTTAAQQYWQRCR